MPNLDGTGPQGLGPMSGGGRGRCTTRGIAEQRLSQPAAVEPGQTTVFGVGRGGRPFGGGRGNCCGGGNCRRGMVRRRGW